MIIKSKRIPVGDGHRFACYLTRPGDNENVEVLRGDPSQILLNEVISSAYRRVYGSRHVIIAPEKHLNVSELGTVLDMIANEFNVPDTSRRRAVIVKHIKKRSFFGICDHLDPDVDSVGLESDIHYHIAFPEVDALTGRVMETSHDRLRQEKVARICEIKFGHRIVLGRFNKEVLNIVDCQTFLICKQDFDPNIYVRTSPRLHMHHETHSSEQSPQILVGWNTSRYHEALREMHSRNLGIIEEGLEYSGDYLSYRVFRNLGEQITKLGSRLGVNIHGVIGKVSIIMIRYREAEISAEVAAALIMQRVNDSGLVIEYDYQKDRLNLVHKGERQSTRIGALKKLGGVTDAVLAKVEAQVQNTSYAECPALAARVC